MKSRWGRCNKLLRESLYLKESKVSTEDLQMCWNQRKWRSSNVWKEKSFCYVFIYMTTPQLQEARQFHCNNKALNISHTNQEIFSLMIKGRHSKVNTSSTSHRESQRKDKIENKGPRNKKQNKTQKQYEQQYPPHSCSGPINSSMYESDFSITTFPLTSSAPYSR